MTILSTVVNQPLKRERDSPKDLDKAASEISGEEKRSEADQLILESRWGKQRCAYDRRVFLARHGLSPKARRSLVRPSVFVGSHRCLPHRLVESCSLNGKKTRVLTSLRVAQKITSVKSAKANCEIRFKITVRRPMFWLCVRWD